MDSLKERLNQNQLCQLLANGEARVANLTDEVVAAGNEAHNLIFAKADFAQTILNFRRGAELPDAHRDTRLNAA
jgi:hypothetical protein